MLTSIVIAAHVIGFKIPIWVWVGMAVFNIWRFSRLTSTINMLCDAILKFKANPKLLDKYTFTAKVK